MRGPRRWGRWISTGDRWVLARIAARESVLLDRVLPLVGRSANYGRLWIGVAGGLAVIGNRRARRAALRGVIALSGASAVTNLVSKRIAGRPRPLVDGIPIVRRLLRGPITTSFPSGHSASAAAFATAVALESPPLAVPVSVLALAVAVSRMVTGAHYPSDVAAGIGIGVGAGLLTLWWWPRTATTPAVAHPVREPVPASSTGAGVVVLVNVDAGGAHADIMTALVAELPDVEIVTAGPDDDLAAVVADAADRARVLAVAGGDGTVNLVARHAVERDVPLLVLPAGTFNHFAREIGIESVSDAIGALRAGSAVRVDVGRVDDDVFLNTFSVGLYADLARFRQRWERRLGKWPAMLLGLVHVLRRSRPHDVVVNGRQDRLWLLFAGNGRYRPTGFAPTYRPSLADGRLDVRVVYGDARWARTRVVLATLTRTLRWTRLYTTGAPSALRIGLPGSLRRMSLDGEVRSAPATVRIRVDRGALLVYRPDAG